MIDARGYRAKPVFVLGMNGSGTTMLLDSLGRHPGLFAFPLETRLIPYLILQTPRFGVLSDDANLLRLWQTVFGLDVFRQANRGNPLPLPEDWLARERDLATVLDAALMHFAIRAGKHRWCEKTPQHVQHIDKLACLFPLAKFIHVIRDGRDCAASFHRRWKRTPELTMYRWKKVVREGQAQGARLGFERYLEVRYEALTADPEPAMRQICAFLGEAFDTAVLESAEPYLDHPRSASGTGRPGRIRQNSGKWRTHFDMRTVDRLDRIGGALLAELGYANRSRLSDYDPPAIVRRWWLLRDYVRQFASQVCQRLRGEIRRPWTVILSRPIVAWRQQRSNRY